MERAMTAGEFQEFLGALVRTMPRDIVADLILFLSQHEVKLQNLSAAITRTAPRGITADRAVYLTRHEDVLADVLEKALTAVEIPLFERFLITFDVLADADFNTGNFPLGDEAPTRRVICDGIGHPISGLEAERTLYTHQGRSPANLRCALEYFFGNPEITKKVPIVILGAKWLAPDNNLLVPVLTMDHKCHIKLKEIDSTFQSNAIFLTLTRE